jgi:MFS family permease
MSTITAPPATEGLSVATGRSVRSTVGFAASAMLVSYLPFSATNGALGRIGAATGAGPGALQWVTDAFTVALTGGVLVGGALAERFGRRRVTIAGLLATVLGALTGWLAGGAHGAGAVHLLWIAQAIAGVGGGLVMSATLALIALTAPSPAARTRSIAVWAAGNVVGLGAGPFLAAAAANWRWMFPPVAVLAILTAAFGAARAREVASAGGTQTDRTGQLTGTLGLVSLVFGVIRGGSAGWTSPLTLAGVAGGVILLAAFLLVEQHAAAPTISPALFASRGFNAAALGAAAALFTVIGIVFVLSIYLAGRGVNDLGVATTLGCLFAGNALASVASGPLQTRVGSRPVLIAGLAVAAVGLVALLGADGPQLAGLSWRLLIVGAGCGTAVASSTSVAVQSVTGPLAAVAGTANNVIRQLGGALGVAVIGGVFAAGMTAGHAPLDVVHTCVAVLLAVLATSAVLVGALLARRAA